MGETSLEGIGKMTTPRQRALKVLEMIFNSNDGEPLWPHADTIREALTEPKDEEVRDIVKEAKSILDEILKDKPAHIVDEVRKNGVGKFVIYELIDHGFIKAAQQPGPEVWRPIETAPPYMDIITITKIALSDGYYEPEVLHHNDFTWYRTDGTRTFGTPTFWMNLPEPPKEKT